MAAHDAERAIPTEAAQALQVLDEVGVHHGRMRRMARLAVASALELAPAEVRRQITHVRSQPRSDGVESLRSPQRARPGT